VFTLVSRLGGPGVGGGWLTSAGVAVVLVSVVAVAALVAAVVFARARGDLQQKVGAAQARSHQLGESLQAVAAERDELAAEAELHRHRADELSALLDAATAAASDSAEAGLWDLLLAHVTRRWGAVVGVPPGGRAIVDGATTAQLAQALARETERLREEVGVDVEFSSPDGTPPANGGVGGDVLAGRVAVLVAALELLGVLASSSQRVTVDVGDALVLTGDGWADPYGELTQAYDRASAAGVVLDPLDVGDERVRLVVRHGPG
jgi:hypothetical protein